MNQKQIELNKRIKELENEVQHETLELNQKRGTLQDLKMEIAQAKKENRIERKSNKHP